MNALNIEFLPCGTSCLLGPLSCMIGGPTKPCLTGGPLMCVVGGPNNALCKIGGPISVCKTGGPISICRIGGPSSPVCLLGPQNPVCPIGGPGLDICKAGPKVGCLAGPPLLEDPKGKIINPADIAGQIVIDTNRLTDEQKLNVGKLVNKLRGI